MDYVTCISNHRRHDLGGWQTHLRLLRHRFAMFNPQLRNREKTWSDCNWTPPNIYSKMSHDYVSGQFWVKAALILRIVFLYARDDSKSKPHCHILIFIMLVPNLGDVFFFNKKFTFPSSPKFLGLPAFSDRQTQTEWRSLLRIRKFVTDE